MNPTATRSRLSRWLHFSTLWMMLAIIAIVSFWRQESWVNRIIIALLGALCAGGIAATRDAGHLERSRIEDPLLALGGAISSMALMRAGGVAPILAATATGLIGGLSVRWIKGARDYHGAPIYAGAFVGITSALVLPSFWWVLLAGVVTGFIWSLSRDAWVGIGGKMGTMALISTFAVSLVARSVHQRGPGAHPLEAHSILLAAFLVGGVAAPVTHYLSHQRGWGAVLGSSVPTAAFSLVMALLPASSHPHGNVLSYLWYGSSFVGMTTPERVARSFWAIALTGLLFTWLALRFGPVLSGMGGTAGVVALVSVFTMRGIQSLSRPKRT